MKIPGLEQKRGVYGKRLLNCVKIKTLTAMKRLFKKLLLKIYWIINRFFMKIKLLKYLFACLMCFNISAHAQSAHTISSHEKIVKDAFSYLNQVWAANGKALSQKITEKYFDPNTTLIINGKKVYSGYYQFDRHFREVGKQVIGKIRFPFLDTINTNDKLIVRFDEDLHDNNGISYPANVIAIFTFYKGKIKEWNEVAYTKYFCRAESTAAVYSK